MQNIMLEQGPDFWCWLDTTQFSYIYIPLCSPNTCKYVFNPNVTTFQSNCAEGLHFSAFIIYITSARGHELSGRVRAHANDYLLSFQS